MVNTALPLARPSAPREAGDWERWPLAETPDSCHEQPATSPIVRTATGDVDASRA